VLVQPGLRQKDEKALAAAAPLEEGGKEEAE